MLQPYNPNESSEIPTVKVETDDSTPTTQIPIYYIHSLEHPFCRNFDCACHLHQRQIAYLLGLVYEGELTLQEAVATEEGRML